MMASTETFTDQELVDRWLQVHAQESMLREERLRIEWQLQSRMEQRGARAIPHPRAECTLEWPSPDYDLGRLARLRELLPPETIAEGWTPEHEEIITVPEKWDGRKLRSWALKYGDEVRNLIDQARLPSRGRIKIKAKESAR